jgi:hypothetical protein
MSICPEFALARCLSYSPSAKTAVRQTCAALCPEKRTLVERLLAMTKQSNANRQLAEELRGYWCMERDLRRANVDLRVALHIAELDRVAPEEVAPEEVVPEEVAPEEVVPEAFYWYNAFYPEAFYPEAFFPEAFFPEAFFPEAWNPAAAQVAAEAAEDDDAESCVTYDSYY